jgi:hypothetical protein
MAHLQKLRPMGENIPSACRSQNIVTDTPQGVLEAFSAARHHLGFYNSVAITAFYSCSATTLSIESLVFAALRILINSHSILGAITHNEDKNSPQFMRLDRIDLKTCTNFIERKKPFVPTEAGEVDQELDALLESQHKLNWNRDIGTRPFWRLIVLHSPGVTHELTITWVFHHALADGISALVFHRDFLAALNSLKDGETLEGGAIVETLKKDLVPPMDKLLDLPLSIPYLITKLWRDWFPRRHPKLWTGAKISKTSRGSDLRLQTIVLSRDNTAKLIQLSRDNKTTLTATLECVTSSAILANLDPSNHDRVKVDGALSFRCFMKDLDIDINNQMGAYVSQYLNEHVHPNSAAQGNGAAGQTTAHDIFSWTEAQATRAVITKEIGKNGKNSVVGLLKWVGNQNTFWLGKVGQDREESFEITNIGVWKSALQENDGDWKIGRVVFSQGSAVTGPAFALSIATGGDGCLVLTFSWLESVVDRVLFEKIIASVRECVNKLVHT